MIAFYRLVKDFLKCFSNAFLKDLDFDSITVESLPYEVSCPSKNRNLKIKQNKKRVNYTINKQTIDRFKIVADKNMRKMSNIVENLIRRYVESRV